MATQITVSIFMAHPSDEFQGPSQLHGHGPKALIVYIGSDVPKNYIIHHWYLPDKCCMIKNIPYNAKRQLEVEDRCCQYAESVSPITFEVKGYGWQLGSLPTRSLRPMRLVRHPAICHGLQPCNCVSHEESCKSSPQVR